MQSNSAVGWRDHFLGAMSILFLWGAATLLDLRLLWELSVFHKLVYIVFAFVFTAMCFTRVVIYVTVIVRSVK